ncbi:hypothetical protein CJ030_MR1G020875 [Morella rubra]|uniref:Uncharacterized protein n=1 Tax=Morella rubra TaxID=262757 RepID=A0A6A1WXM6_9ROSI|nr:hypothetical protein CJ030_MR1G020875 [Morella rubra]
MAIAGLHNISVHDSSFISDSLPQASGRRGDEESVRPQASSLLRMWRELEDEHGVSCPQQERVVQQRSDRAVADLSRGHVSDTVGNQHGGGWEITSLSESDCGTWSQIQIGSQNEHIDSSNSNCEDSSDLGEVERERVRADCSGSE